MSLTRLLPPVGTADVLAAWPEKPAVYDPAPPHGLDAPATAAMLRRHVTLGCYPPQEIALVKAPTPSLTQNAFMTNGRTDASKLTRLYDNGHTIRLGNLQRVVPEMAELSLGLQKEVGYSNYIHGFLTPPRSQGLRHHWDQQLAIIVQLAGTKRWELWHPPVLAPMREYNESWRVWNPHFVEEWQVAGPDQVVDLQPGQVLLVPRGWVHNPHTLNSDQESIHLTVAIRERTKLWLSEQLVATAINDPEFRRVIQPTELDGNELVASLETVRRQLVTHLQGLDLEQLGAQVREAAEQQLEYTS